MIEKEIVKVFLHPPTDGSLEFDVSGGWPVIEGTGIQFNYRGKAYCVTLGDSVELAVCGLEENGDLNGPIAVLTI